eukprot:Skav226004  [mRNA]  locus=scaffold1010:96057:99800:- [translate_table: standard]
MVPQSPGFAPRSGCLIEFREVQYEWTVEPPKPPAPKEPPKDAAAGAPDAAPTVAPKTAAPPIPQLVQFLGGRQGAMELMDDDVMMKGKFRVDCQEPKVEGLTALEVWDKHHNCGRVDYTKYLSPGPSAWSLVIATMAQPFVEGEGQGDGGSPKRRRDRLSLRAPARLDDIVVEHLDDDAELEVQWQARAPAHGQRLMWALLAGQLVVSD